MEQHAQLRQEFPPFDTNIATFNPEALEFKPTPSGTSAVAGHYAGPMVPQPNDSTTTSIEELPSQQTQPSASTFPGMLIPQGQTVSLRHLMPHSDMPAQPWLDQLEHHAMNLGLSIAPHRVDSLTQDTLDDGGGVSLGLPKDNIFSATFTPNKESNHPGFLFPLETRAFGLDGKLVQQALTKPLTAGDLAKHLESCNIASLAERNISPSTRRSTFDGPGLSATPPKTFFTPPQQPYTPPSADRTAIHDFATYSSSPRVVSSNKQYRTPTHSSRQTHGTPRSVTKDRRGSGRGRFLRSYFGKPRRADQGPEPSSADIYPEDALSPPNANYSGGHHIVQHPVNFHQNTTKPASPPTPTKNLLVDNTAVWPTPAEAKTGKPATEALTVSKSVVPPPETQSEKSDAVVTHSTKSVTNTCATPLNFPEISGLHIGALNLIPDTRPLTPSQIDGQRYGLRFFGIGLNDEWTPPAVKIRTGGKVTTSKDLCEDAEHWPAVCFRTRPRFHGGWGGKEWARKQDWYDNDAYKYQDA